MVAIEVLDGVTIESNSFSSTPGLRIEMSSSCIEGARQGEYDRMQSLTMLSMVLPPSGCNVLLSF